MIKQFVLFIAQLHDSVRAVAKVVGGGYGNKCNLPTTNLDAPTSNLKNIKDKHAGHKGLRDDNIMGKSTGEREG